MGGCAACTATGAIFTIHGLLRAAPPAVRSRGGATHHGNTVRLHVRDADWAAFWASCVGLVLYRRKFVCVAREAKVYQGFPGPQDVSENALEAILKECPAYFTEVLG